MKSLGKFLLLTACVAAAQSPQTSRPAAPAASATSIDVTQLAAIVKQQFGDTFTIPPKFSSPFIAADFDGDSVEDVAIVADSKDPLPDSYDFKYVVADPYNAYFGMGNPRISALFGSADRSRNHSLLVIFGAGKEAWRSATPKAKFVLINIPFDTVEAGRMLTRKKNTPPIFVIKAVESQLMDSAVWFDAKRKKWHWEPGGVRD